jgi:hypothetical protein
LIVFSGTANIGLKIRRVFREVDQATVKRLRQVAPNGLVYWLAPIRLELLVRMRENLKARAAPGVAMQFGTNDQHKKLAFFAPKKKNYIGRHVKHADGSGAGTAALVPLIGAAYITLFTYQAPYSCIDVANGCRLLVRTEV